MISEQVETSWVREEFAEVELKDLRLNRRCQDLAEALSEQPTAPINQACEDWADTKAAYRFFDNPKVEPEGIRKPHQERTVERMKGYSLVLGVQDTSFLNYSHHPQTEDLGRIGNKKQNQQGFGMHSTLVLTTKGLPLGILTQKFFTRPWDEASHQPNELRQMPIEDKESYKWLEAFEQSLERCPEGVELLSICDREGDIYEMFDLAQEKEAKLLVRASSDRCVEGGKLWSQVEQQEPIAQLHLKIPSNQNRSTRQAQVSVRFTQVTLKPPWRPQQKKLPPVTLSAILVREDHPDPNVDDPIEWLLLTNMPLNTHQDVLQMIDYYCSRWQIELFHKILKSGCTVEDCRLQTADRLQNYIALMAVIAWRLHWLTYINRSEPDLPCTSILTDLEWQALYVRIHKTSFLPNNPPSVGQAVRWIAQLGGFLGRKGDGEPGITTIWRGWHRLHDIVSTWHFINPIASTSG